jgi:hypothetical protein
MCSRVMLQCLPGIFTLWVLFSGMSREGKGLKDKEYDLKGDQLL